MSPRTWLITGVSSGFGRELTTQLLERGDRVVGTVRRPDAVAELTEHYPDTFHAELLEVTDTAAIRDVEAARRAAWPHGRFRDQRARSLRTRPVQRQSSCLRTAITDCCPL